MKFLNRRPECKSSTIEFIAPQVRFINIIQVVGFEDPVLVEKESSCKCQIFIPELYSLYFKVLKGKIREAFFKTGTDTDNC